MNFIKESKKVLADYPRWKNAKLEFNAKKNLIRPIQ